MHYTFYPKGVCSTQIDLDVDDNGRVHNIAYTGGCNGNLKALSALAEGLTVAEVVNKLYGITCGFKGTSCSERSLSHADGFAGSACALAGAQNKEAETRF